MADDYYPVVPVAIHEVEESADEYLGTKRKLWVLRDDGRWWLYKQARPNVPGEAWAEKIAAGIAELIGVSHAGVELANESVDGLGTISPSFMPRQGWLYHGNDILYAAIAGYDRGLRSGQSEHNISNIIQALTALADDENIHLDLCQTITGLAGYAVLDGLIGNTDRHHENWGLIYDSERDAYNLAPSFDHASALGRNLTDDQRNDRLSSRGGVLAYLSNRAGRTFIDPNRRQGPSPLQLAQTICLAWPGVVRPVLERLSDVTSPELRNAINRVPPSIMSRPAKKFAHQMVMTGKTELLRGFRKSPG